MNKLLLLCFFLSAPTFADSFCSRTQQDLKHGIFDADTRIAFKNNGGLFNGGVCWWHSRLQRSSLYLAKFAPAKNPPTAQEVRGILRSLKTMRHVVTIPGYSNFHAFSKDHEGEIQKMLNLWQKEDGFLNLEWIRGISGQSSLTPEGMRVRMSNVYAHYKSSPVPVWVMAQVKGVTSHSLLIVDMKETSNGLDLWVVDSNHPVTTVPISYSFGDRSLRANGEDYSFVPYVGFQKDFKKILPALEEACPNITAPIDLEGIRDGDVEF